MLFTHSTRALTGLATMLFLERGTAVPTTVSEQLQVRQTNSWPSTNTFQFFCHGLTLPVPGGAEGQGEGGVGIFTKDGPVMTAPDGSTVYPTDCVANGYGYTGCHFDSGWLMNPITDAWSTYVPAGGWCNMGYSYLGVQYSTSDGGACATQKCGLQPFSCDQTAICYAEACAAGSGCGVAAGGYAAGQCGVHVTQYQKPDPSVDPYTLDVHLKDAYGNDIGDATGVAVPANTQATVTSALPWTLQVGVLNVDDDPIQFWYADQFWDSNSAQCSTGAYDSGSRNMDCGFTC